MAKKAVSLTIDEQNLTWLRGLTARSGNRSLSDTVDQLITSARQTGASAGASRSVVGTIDINADDPDLLQADAFVRGVFDRSLTRPFVVKEPRTGLAAPRKRGRRG